MGGFPLFGGIFWILESTQGIYSIKSLRRKFKFVDSVREIGEFDQAAGEQIYSKLVENIGAIKNEEVKDLMALGHKSQKWFLELEDDSAESGEFLRNF